MNNTRECVTVIQSRLLARWEISGNDIPLHIIEPKKLAQVWHVLHHRNPLPA